MGAVQHEVSQLRNESVMVRSEERSIYTPSENPTVQIYVGSPDADLGTSDVSIKYCSQRVRSPRVKVSVGTPGKRRDFRRSELPANIGTSDVHRQRAVRSIGAGTLGEGRDFRLSGVPTYVGTSDTESHRKNILCAREVLE